MYIAVGLKLLNFAARELQQALSNNETIITPIAAAQTRLPFLIGLASMTYFPLTKDSGCRSM